MEQPPDEDKRQEKRDRIGRLRTRLEQVRDKQPDLGPLVGILKGMLELMADET